MNWVLYVVLASSTASDKAINATPVPMATEQLCNDAKNKLFESYRRSNTPELSNGNRVPAGALGDAVSHTPSNAQHLSLLTIWSGVTAGPHLARACRRAQGKTSQSVADLLEQNKNKSHGRTPTSSRE